MTSKSIYKVLRGNIGHYYQHCILFWFVLRISSTVALSFFHYVIRFVGLSAVTLLICLINALPVVSLAKLYVMMSPPFRVGRHIVFPLGIYLSVTFVSTL